MGKLMPVNDDVADAITAHSIDLSRFAEDLVARVLPVLSRVERSLVADVAEIDPTAGTTLSNRQRRLKLLLEQTRETIATAYTDIADTVGGDLHDVAKVSDKAGRKVINDAVGVEIQTVAIAPEQLRALADGTMIEGAVVKEHWDRQSESLRQKFTDRVQQGYMRGEPSTEIVNRVRGTKARGYADGIMVGTKHGAGALVRTSVQAVSNSARLESFRKNSDVLGAVQWLSTLDNKTCLTFETKIKMANGSVKAIGDIKTGELVLGGSLQSRRVVGTTAATAKRLVRVTMDNGQTILSTDDHLFLVQENGRQIWMEAQDLLPNTDIACRLGGVD
jgi:hypothetical protein